MQMKPLSVLKTNNSQNPNESSSSSISKHSIDKALLRGNVVMRQELKSYTPNCNIKCGVAVFVVLLILFLAFGIPIIVIAGQVQQITLDFTDCTEAVCSRSFTLNKAMAPPVYLYYEVANFFDNHRFFQKSQNFAQLKGTVDVDSSNNKNCKGAQFVYELFDNDTSRYLSYTGKPLQADDYANPCGLIAKSMYNDTQFRVIDDKERDLFINETGITNAYDRKYVFKANENYTDKQWINVMDEHFIVWMQMETFPEFRKLWGRITENITEGNYTLRFKNNWNVTSFKGKKKITLSTSSMVGTGMFFGFVLCGAAVFCIIMLFVIWICEMTRGKRVYTTKDLKWD